MALQSVYAIGSVTTTGGAYAGGLVADNAANISGASYSPTGAGVSGLTNVGGLGGENEDGTITASSASGTVSLTNNVGGLIGNGVDNASVILGSSSTARGWRIAQRDGRHQPRDQGIGTGDDVGGIAGASFADIQGGVT